jgi:hypothetical protein
LDAVFEAELFPEFAADLIAALAYLEGYYFTRHGGLLELIFCWLLFNVLRVTTIG